MKALTLLGLAATAAFAIAVPAHADSCRESYRGERYHSSRSGWRHGCRHGYASHGRWGRAGGRRGYYGSAGSRYSAFDRREDDNYSDRYSDQEEYVPDSRLDRGQDRDEDQDGSYRQRGGPAASYTPGSRGTRSTRRPAR